MLWNSMDVRLVSKLGRGLLSKLVDPVQRAGRFGWGDRDE